MTEDQVLQRFLSSQASFSEFVAVANHPELLKNRRVQIKITRSLRSTNKKIFQAALALCMESPELKHVPRVYRRFQNLLLSPKLETRTAILDLAISHPKFLKNLVIIGVISEALMDKQSVLSETALSIIRQNKYLKKNPAIVHALTIYPEFESSGMKLPDYEVFKSQVEPILRLVGEDNKACVNCHGDHPILRLQIEQITADREKTIKSHYRSALRVIDLVQPKKSMLLVKPTSPGTKEHGGGIRFEKHSTSYKSILNWIRTGQP